MSNDSDLRWSEETTRFGILIVVMIGIVLVVAISRPLIFEHIIPVILGEGVDSTIRQAELEPPVRPPQEGEAVDSVQEDMEADRLEAAGEEEGSQAVEPAAPETEATEEETTNLEGVTTDAEGGAEADTAEPITHVVRTGETLTSIADQYGVTVSALIEANNLASPNRIRIGDLLTIPEP
jgi:LysM repeat protein